MYKNKILKNSYTFAYVMWVFGIILFPLMYIKDNLIPLIVIFEIIAAIALAGMIVSQVYYSKNKKIYLISSLIGLGSYTLVCISALITETIYAFSGDLSVDYYIFILALTIVATALVDTIYTLDIIKSKHHD